MLLVLIAFGLISGLNCELFSSTEEMKLLIGEHGEFVFDLTVLVNAVEEELTYMKSKLEYYKKNQELMTKNPERYISNPLNAFTLIKHLTNDSIMIKKKFKSSIEEFTQSILDLTPKLKDLKGAVEGIARLQRVYRLKTEDLARGVILPYSLNTDGIKKGFVVGEQYSEGLSAHDMFVIGSQLVESGKFSRAIEYLKGAIEKNVKEEESEIVNAHIYSRIAEAYQNLGQYKSANEFFDKSIDLEPENSEVIEKKNILEKRIKDGDIVAENEDEEDIETRLTEAVCNGEVTRSSKELSMLRCRHVTRSGFSKLAPFKLEETHLDPYIVLFHDVVYDKEIEILKKISASELYNSDFYVNGTARQSSTVRISKVAWFYDDDASVAATISKRLEEMTGLTMDTAESLQVQHYGIGGFYTTHYDFIPKKFDTYQEGFEHGNRIATALFYLSSVEKGGATVFPYLKVNIPAVKGSAAFWYNLHASGGGDHRTRHSGCPVLVGSKWVANKWIHEHGQEKRRPCELTLKETFDGDLDVVLDLFEKGKL